MTVILTGLSIAASTFVGVAAWRTSVRATRIAEAALAAERRRDLDRYESTITEAMARLILALAEHAEQTAVWMEVANELEASAPPGQDPDTLPYPPMPRLAPVTAQLEAARLLARDEDRQMLALIHRFQMVVQAGRMYKRPKRLDRLIAAVREWRDGSNSRDETATALKAAITQMTSDDA